MFDRAQVSIIMLMDMYKRYVKLIDICPDSQI